MTEQKLKDSGFTLNEDNDGKIDYRYYTYNIADGLGFISSDNDEVVDDVWYVEFIDSNPVIRYYDINELMSVINSLEKHKV